MKRQNIVIPGIAVRAGDHSIREPRGPHDRLNVTGCKGVIIGGNCEKVLLVSDLRPERVSKDLGQELQLVVKGNRNGGKLGFPVRLESAKPTSEADGLMGSQSSIVLTVMKKPDQVKVEKLFRHVQEQPVYERFEVMKRVYFGDTNVEGNVYYANYFHWQGIAREEFYRQVLPTHAELLDSGVHIITAHASMSFRSQLTLFDLATIEVRVRAIRTANLELSFRFRNEATGDMIGEGLQVITFAGPDRKVMRVPEEVIEAASLYYDPFDFVVARL